MLPFTLWGLCHLQNSLAWNISDVEIITSGRLISPLYFLTKYSMQCFVIFRCKRFNGAVGQGATRNIVCARRVTGRYVYVMLRGTNWLTLCEVVVFGKRLVGRYNYDCIYFPQLVLFLLVHYGFSKQSRSMLMKL